MECLFYALVKTAQLLIFLRDVHVKMWYILVFLFQKSVIKIPLIIFFIKKITLGLLTFQSKVIRSLFKILYTPEQTQLFLGSTVLHRGLNFFFPVTLVLIRCSFNLVSRLGWPSRPCEPPPPPTKSTPIAVFNMQIFRVHFFQD